MATKLTAVEKKRQELYNNMPVPLRQVADDFSSKMKAGAKGAIMIHYALGCRIKDVLEEEGTYGRSACKQLAAYLDLEGGETALYNLRNMVNAFDRDYVEETSSQPMATGRYMSVQHWIYLSRVEGVKARQKLVRRVLDESLSSNALLAEITAGMPQKNAGRTGAGRPAQVSTNPAVAVQKAGELAQKWVRYEEQAHSLFEGLAELEPEQVNMALISKIKEARARIEDNAEKATSLAGTLEEAETKLEEILDSKYEAAEESHEDAEAKDAEAEEAVPAKKSVKKAASVSANGKKKKKKAVAT
jgi:hypothetical protein